MDTLELQSYLDRNNKRNIVLKVSAIDQLPKKIKRNVEYGIIINLSKSDDPGSHWTAVYFDKDGLASYFDSYGFKGRGHYIESFIKRNCKKFEYNNQQLQQLSSKVCGMYSALFILHKMNGGSIKSFVSRFSKNLLLNDLIVEKLYNFNK